ncbi:MAG: hypothetical protein ACO3MG_02615 [Saprospiraceae bacterium]
MIQPGKTTALTKEEFLCFLMIYASHLDYELCENEESFILKRFDKSVFNKMYNLFNSNNDYKSFKIILSHKQDYFSNASQLKEIFELLSEVFAADGEISRTEKIFIPFFLKMKDLDVYEPGN